MQNINAEIKQLRELCETVEHWVNTPECPPELQRRARNLSRSIVPILDALEERRGNIENKKLRHEIKLIRERCKGAADRLAGLRHDTKGGCLWVTEEEAALITHSLPHVLDALEALCAQVDGHNAICGCAGACHRSGEWVDHDPFTCRYPALKAERDHFKQEFERLYDEATRSAKRAYTLEAAHDDAVRKIWAGRYKFMGYFVYTNHHSKDYCDGYIARSRECDMEFQKLLAALGMKENPK